MVILVNVNFAKYLRTILTNNILGYEKINGLNVNESFSVVHLQ